MAHDNKHHRLYALIAKTLSELGIAHDVSGAWGNDIIRVSRSTMHDPMQVVLKLQEVCGNTVVVYWNPIDELACVTDRTSGWGRPGSQLPSAIGESAE